MRLTDGAKCGRSNLESEEIRQVPINSEAKPWSCQIKLIGTISGRKLKSVRSAEHQGTALDFPRHGCSNGTHQQETITMPETPSATGLLHRFRIRLQTPSFVTACYFSAMVVLALSILALLAIRLLGPVPSADENPWLLAALGPSLQLVPTFSRNVLGRGPLPAPLIIMRRRTICF